MFFRFIYNVHGWIQMPVMPEIMLSVQFVGGMFIMHNRILSL